MNEHSLQDKVVLITGAGRAPAPSLALSLAQQGAIVAVNDLSPTLLDSLAEQIRARGGRIQSYIADATRGMPLRAMLDEVLSDWGRIDILINNPRVRPSTAVLDMDEWDWQRTIEMNLNGPFLVTQLVARSMREMGEGVIINIVDNNPQTLAAPGSSAYAASQQGLLAMSRTAGQELIAYNIRVYTLCPEEGILASQPTSTDSRGGEIFTRFALFLCGPAAVNLNGQVYRVFNAQIDPHVPEYGNGLEE
jgi:3-oxoacyl-[acyl-carrier protein] reductase